MEELAIASSNLIIEGSSQEPLEEAQRQLISLTEEQPPDLRPFYLQKSPPKALSPPSQQMKEEQQNSVDSKLDEETQAQGAKEQTQESRKHSEQGQNQAENSEKQFLSDKLFAHLERALGYLESVDCTNIKKRKNTKIQAAQQAIQKAHANARKIVKQAARLQEKLKYQESIKKVAQEAASASAQVLQEALDRHIQSQMSTITMSLQQQAELAINAIQEYAHHKVQDACQTLAEEHLKRTREAQEKMEESQRSYTDRLNKLLKEQLVSRSIVPTPIHSSSPIKSRSQVEEGDTENQAAEYRPSNPQGSPQPSTSSHPPQMVQREHKDTWANRASQPPKPQRQKPTQQQLERNKERPPPALIIKPLDHALRITEVAETLSRLKSAAPIASVRTRQNQIEIKCPSQEARDSIRKQLTQDCPIADQLGVTDKRPPSTKIILYGVNSIFTEADITEALAQDVGNIEEREPGEIFQRILPARNSDSQHWQLELPRKQAKTLLQKGKFTLGYQQIRVAKYIPAARCFNCQALGHIARNCIYNTQCATCAGDHATRDCTARYTKCINCELSNSKEGTDYSINHPAHSGECPTYRAHIKGKTSNIPGTKSKREARQKEQPSHPERGNQYYSRPPNHHQEYEGEFSSTRNRPREHPSRQRQRPPYLDYYFKSRNAGNGYPTHPPPNNTGKSQWTRIVRNSNRQ